jgi:hypothetical protein
VVTVSKLLLTESQQSELSAVALSRSLLAGYVFRAKLILMLAEGASFSTIKRQLQTTAPTIIRWKQRFLGSSIDGLEPAGLYLRPPQHAAVFCIDEKTAIQALDRLDPVLPALAGTCGAPRL